MCAFVILYRQVCAVLFPLCYEQEDWKTESQAHGTIWIVHKDCALRGMRSFFL